MKKIISELFWKIFEISNWGFIKTVSNVKFDLQSLYDIQTLGATSKYCFCDDNLTK